MKYIKTFENHSVNEEFNKFDRNKIVAVAAGIFSTALNVVLFKWSKIPGIWKNVGDYNVLMNVMQHLSDDIFLNDMSESDWVELIKRDVNKYHTVKYSHITTGPSKYDLSIAYMLEMYPGENGLASDISKSIELIDKLDPDKKIKLKDVREMLELTLDMINNYNKCQSEMLIKRM